jgi:uncharacterized protein (TIGR02145 family)
MKQGKRIQMLLLAALSGLSVMGYAQGKACFGTAYEIKELSAPSAPSTFQWMENGQEITGANSATYTIPADKPVGRYTYLRNSLKEGCEWASSNIFTVEVITCGPIAGGAQVGTMGTFKDLRDNRVYKIVMMPDERVWFAENLNYQTDLVFNQSADVANSMPFTTAENGAPAIGSFWCPGRANNSVNADKNTCGIYGALYTWETAMMVDGKWADELQSSSTWDESWVSSNYFPNGTAPAANNNGNVNNARATRGICPPGWYVPTDYDWANMLDKVEGNVTYTLQSETGLCGAVAGAKIRTTDTYFISDPGNGSWNGNGSWSTNETGFSAVPNGGVTCVSGIFTSRGGTATWHSSSVTSIAGCRNRTCFRLEGGVNRYSSSRSNAYGVRCMRTL